MLDFSDATKLQTREGNRVRIYAIDAGGDFPVHGAYYDDGVWEVGDWACSGAWSLEVKGEHNLDLIPYAPPRTGECWLNVYASESGAMWTAGHSTKREAESSGDTNCIARIRVDLIEGRFDS